MYLPYTQVHIPPIPDPEYAGATKRGNFADLLTQMDAFTGASSTTLDELGLADDTIVVWASDNGADPNYRMPAIDPDPAGGAWQGCSGPWRGGYFTSLEGSNRAPCIVRWPGKVPAGQGQQRAGPPGRHVHHPGARRGGAGPRPTGRSTAWTWRDFLLGDAEESGRNTVLCIQGNRLQAVKWHQWKAHLFQQDGFMSTWSPLQHAPAATTWSGTRARSTSRLPARLGRPPDGRRRGGIPTLPRDRAADQAWHPRPVHPATSGRAAPRGTHPTRCDHPVRHDPRQVPRSAPHHIPGLDRQA